MFNLVGVTTGQSIELLGMFSEAMQNPLSWTATCRSKRASTSSTPRATWATKSVGAGRHRRDARAQVLAEAHALLEEVEHETIWGAIARGAFADVKRTREGGKGYAGVIEKARRLSRTRSSKRSRKAEA